MNTHAAFLEVEGASIRIAGGTPRHCAQVLAGRLLWHPGATGYVRELTSEELR